VQAKAEETRFPDRSFDLVAAGQCWHWFDRVRATAEARRVLVSGGRIVIAHFDWLALRGSVVAATEALVVKHNPAWRGAGMHAPYPRYYDDLTEAGFRDIESFTFDLDVSYGHEAWLGRIRASAGIGAALDPEAVARFDQEHKAMLRRDFPTEPLLAPHRVFALWGSRPA
jgi:SAM-dependent methyltransferase